MTEAQFQTMFNRWLKYRFNGNAAFELKVAKGGKLYMSNIKDHQIQSLLAVKNGKLIYKIPDIGNSRKPFDCFIFNKNPNAFLVVYYTENKKFYLIDINILVSLSSMDYKYIDIETAKNNGIECEFV